MKVKDLGTVRCLEVICKVPDSRVLTIDLGHYLVGITAESLPDVVDCFLYERNPNGYSKIQQMPTGNPEPRPNDSPVYRTYFKHFHANSLWVDFHAGKASLKPGTDIAIHIHYTLK